MTYSFDQKGHLQNRRDNITNQQESFLYDAMNRLSSWSIINNGTAVASINMDYDPNTGVIKNKSDIGYEMNYGENGTSPYRMTSISGKPDNISGENQLITYTDFKKVSTIKEGSKTLDYLYGVDNQRRKTTYKNGSATKIRYYSNNYEEEIDNGRIRRIHYINGSNGLAAIYIEENDNNVLYYAFSDYLGSLTALALPNGTVKERYAYDPWGNRRNPANWNLRDTRTSFIIPRGYTMHEHLMLLFDRHERTYMILLLRCFSLTVCAKSR
ncbi:MAG: hypothetical protein ACLVKE_15255 [Clostridium baratii]